MNKREEEALVKRLANLTVADMRKHKEKDPRAAVDRILKAARIPISDEIRSKILAEIDRRGGKKAARNKAFGRKPQDTSGLFPTSLFARRDRSVEPRGWGRKDHERNH